MGISVALVLRVVEVVEVVEVAVDEADEVDEAGGAGGAIEASHYEGDVNLFELVVVFVSLAERQ